MTIKFQMSPDAQATLSQANEVANSQYGALEVFLTMGGAVVVGAVAVTGLLIAGSFGAKKYLEFRDYREAMRTFNSGNISSKPRYSDFNRTYSEGLTAILSL